MSEKYAGLTPTVMRNEVVGPGGVINAHKGPHEGDNTKRPTELAAERELNKKLELIRTLGKASENSGKSSDVNDTKELELKRRGFNNPGFFG